MLASPIKGIIGAALTPFTDDGKVDYDALGREIEFLVADCDAVSVAAVEASEYTVLSLQDRKEVMRRATEIVNKRVPVILGASSHSIDTVLDLADHAAAVGGGREVEMHTRLFTDHCCIRFLSVCLIFAAGLDRKIIIFNNKLFSIYRYMIDMRNPRAQGYSNLNAM